MRSLPISRPHLDDPLYSQKNPHQTFLLVLCVISSWPLIQGHANSSTLERELDDSTLIAWGLCLLGGSAVALVGEFWRGHTWDGLNIERFGIALVGAAALIYATIVWTSAARQSDVAFAAGITMAYGLSCAWRVGQITRRLAWIRRMQAEINEFRPLRQEDGDPE